MQPQHLAFRIQGDMYAISYVVSCKQQKTWVNSRVKTFIGSKLRVLEVGVYQGQPYCSAVLPEVLSLGRLFQKYGCAPSLTLGTHNWHLGT